MYIGTYVCTSSTEIVFGNSVYHPPPPPPLQGTAGDPGKEGDTGLSGRKGPPGLPGRAGADGFPVSYVHTSTLLYTLWNFMYIIIIVYAAQQY